ncbi:hypothetical protein [Phytohabitans houttuyneae]|uniref:Uncharacterized protein n=1 Tax=Phytohabitans houttuyneae TaxID=1076126 RepID=A0A6V8K706_9ACTN|nr:hypothetical protein [Phytohabitans houttuyneae]GFJ80983.1 hypothetical protein Phou_051630 [Phytohabitans houttuyneae]
MPDKQSGDRMPRPEELTGTQAPTGDVREVQPRPPAPGAGFLRVRMGVEDGTLIVHSARFVDTGQVVAEPLRPGYAYEFSAQGHRIWSANLADFGVRRSFPNPQGLPAQQTHHVIQDPNPRFEARVPASAFSTTDISQVEVALYRLTRLPAEAAAGAAVPGRPTPDVLPTREPGPSTPAVTLSALPREDGELVARAGAGILAGLPAEYDTEVRRALSS